MSTHAAPPAAPQGCGDSRNGRAVPPPPDNTAPKPAPSPMTPPAHTRAATERGDTSHANGGPTAASIATGDSTDNDITPEDLANKNISIVDGQRYRSVLGRFATGVVAITALDPETGEPRGLSANSFTSVSLDPPLVAFCVAHTSTSWPRVRAATTHCVNILGEDQQHISVQLSARGGDKFAGLTWKESPSGNPVFDGALAWIECTIEAEHIAGDHLIVVARVHQLAAHADGGPLIFFRGGYGRFSI